MNQAWNYPPLGAHQEQATIHGGPLQQVGYRSTVQELSFMPQERESQPQGHPPSYQAVQDLSYIGSDFPHRAKWDGGENVASSLPAAPPTEMFGQFAGYESTAFGTDHFLPPPPIQQVPLQQQAPEQHFLQATAISNYQARESLLAFVAENCCYGKSAARDMEIKDITPSSAYHYKLESYCESRSTSWKFDPYWGQQIDGPQNGPAPPPWSIPVSLTQFFKPQEAYVEVPHTASVKPCHVCKATGIIRCYSCEGKRKIYCTHCGGSGRRLAGSGPNAGSSLCSYCSGGKIKCPTCQGKGRVTCLNCKGQRRVKMYILLTVKWECHTDNSVVERTELPSHLIVESPGLEIFAQELPMIYPISLFHDRDVNRVSRQLVAAHSRNWPTKRIIRQRQALRSVPVSQVKYDWKDVSARFWVYGLDHKVHAPNYPQQCCCGCTIL